MHPRTRHALILILGIFAVLLVFYAVHFQSVSEARDAVLIRYGQFQHYLEEGEYTKAYGFMTDAYRERQPITEFQILFVSIADKEYRRGKHTGVKINGDRAEICPTSENGWFGPHFLGTSYVLKKLDGAWLFTGEMGLLAAIGKCTTSAIGKCTTPKAVVL